MLYDVIEKRRGKIRIVFTGNLQKANDYQDKMRRLYNKGIGRRQDNVEYSIVPSEDKDKFKQKPIGWHQ